MNSLDRPFHVGDKVKVSVQGHEVYGHSGKFPIGRKGVIQFIPSERWHNNEVGFSFLDEQDISSIAGCWAFDLDIDKEILATQLAKTETKLAIATAENEPPYFIRKYRERIAFLRKYQGLENDL